MPDQQETPAKIEYDRLIAYFDKVLKLTLLGIGIIIGAASLFLWKNTDDVKTQAAASIKATQDSANHEVAEIGKAAQATAKEEAQKAIDAAFEKQNVQRLIESTAQRKVDAAVEAAVRRNLGARIEAFRTLINEIGEISNYGAQLRLGFRSGLSYILQKRESPDPTVRAYASSTLRTIAADYEKSEAIFRTDYQKPDFLFYPQLTAKQLMALIKTPPEDESPVVTNQIVQAFLDMKRRFHWDVQVFDVPAAEKWCAAHKPTCDQ